eukprot:TRINITY_DN1043_c0_g2_i1.p1 TRINITY_DN1043_c0_g2~~TRINITY_DN1043_c0_g2_i1.p1  ORF type:complete len:348 (+),score=57.76 TRINITY_DN1043_c0_g2_i1:227-1270(+)
MNYFILFLVAIPISFICGFGTATVGMTSWGLIVPLLLDGFDISVENCVAVSVSIDVVNSFVLTMIYLKTKKINFFFVMVMAFPALFFAVFIYLIFGSYFMSNYPRFFKGTVGALVFVGAFAFWGKGYIEYKKDKKRKLYKEQSNTPIQETDVPNSDLGLYIDDDGTDESGIKLQNELNQKWFRNYFEDSVILFSGRCQEGDKQKKPGCMIGLFLLSANLVWLSELIGMFSGLLGFGGGILFVLIFMIGFPRSIDHLLATGTSVCSMFIIMIGLLITIFASTKEVQDNITDLSILISVLSVCSLIGTLIGSYICLKISRTKLIIFSASILTIVATFATLQPIILSLIK